MAASGVAVNDDVVTKYLQLKKGKPTKLQYLLCKLSSDSKYIEVEKEAPNTVDEDDENGIRTAFEQFVSQLPDKEARYALYDFKFKMQDSYRAKILFIVWCPDTAPVKVKMLTSSSKEGLKKKFDSPIEFQASEPADLDYKEVLERVKAMMRI